MSWKNSVWIGGVARSGTSWVGQIFNSHPEVRFRFQPLFSYEFKGSVNADSTAEEHMKFLDGLWGTESEFLTQADKVRSGDYPDFKHSGSETTLVFKENRYQSVIEPMLRRVPNAKVIGLVRNPCAVINSWKNNAKEFPPGSVLRDEWRFGECKNSGPEDYFGYYKWKEVANLYLDLATQYPTQACVVRYEDIVHKRVERCEEMFKFIDLELDPQTTAFLEQSGGDHKGSYYSVYKDNAVTTKWRDDLDPYIISEIEQDLAGTRLEQFLLDPS
jgi:hypothetical protein